jgi:hypothetical protein
MLNSRGNLATFVAGFQIGPYFAQSSVQWEPAVLSSEIKLVEREAHHLPHLTPSLRILKMYRHFPMCLSWIVLT